MERRRQPSPWIHRHSRTVLGAIALFGAAITAYLSFVELTGGEAICPTNGCNVVLSSPYAHLFGLPLPLFGLVGYLGMAALALGPKFLQPKTANDETTPIENWSWFLLLIGSFAMAVFSGYLMYLLAFEIHALCPYCITSALLSFSLLSVTLAGRRWDDLGQVLFTGGLVVFVTLIGVVGLYSTVNHSGTVAASEGVAPPPIQAHSGPAEMALARYLKSIGAKEYSAFWCPHCQQQRELFGSEAFSAIDSIECAEGGQDAQPQLCRDAGITGFPTWIINGESYPGTRSLNELADLSGYSGPRNFRS